MKPFGLVKSLLRKRKRVGIIACNSCARACETGGREKMNEMAARLQKEGYEVVQKELVPMACNVDMAKKPEILADELVILACDGSILTFQMLFPSKKFIPALDTLGLGARDNQGNIIMMKEL